MATRRNQPINQILILSLNFLNSKPLKAFMLMNNPFRLMYLWTSLSQTSASKKHGSCY